MFIEGALLVLSNPVALLLIFLCVIIGIIFGSIPGLSATMALAIFLPMTYSMDKVVGLSSLIALYIGGISGGLIAAILLKIPGTPSSVATCFDGSPMAEKGEAGKALGTGIVFSFLGTIVSILILVTVAPIIANFALKFGPYEYFAITVFAMSLISTLTGSSLVKGLISGVLGVIFSTVGLAPVDNVVRYTFGSIQFKSGFNLLTVLLGLYAVSEIFLNAEKRNRPQEAKITENLSIKGFGFSMKEFVSQLGNMFRSALIGVGIGVLPGVGGGTSNILAYTAAKTQSKHPEKFGTGIMDGVVATETANNATIGGAIIPLLTLGIPGDSVTAMLLGGLIIHGVTPGPLIFTQHGDIVYAIYTAMVLASIVMLFTEFFGIKGFVKILRVPKNILLPIIFVMCSIGAFGLNNRVFDIWATIIFGVIGYGMQKADYPLPPLILGFILGGTMELNLRRGFTYSQGSFLPFIQSPIAAIFLSITLLSIFLKLLQSYKKFKKKVN